MPVPYDREFFIPKPSRTTLFFRTFFPWQLLRFAWINLKMNRHRAPKVPRRPIRDLSGGHGEPAADATGGLPK